MRPIDSTTPFSSLIPSDSVTMAVDGSHGGDGDPAEDDADVGMSDLMGKWDPAALHRQMTHSQAQLHVTTMAEYAQIADRQHQKLTSTIEQLRHHHRKKGNRNTFWMTEEEETDKVIEQSGKESWQAKVLSTAHSERVQHTLMGLLVLDVLVIFVELFLEAEYPRCDIVIRDAISCGNATGLAAVSPAGRRMLGGGAPHTFCAAPLVDMPGYAAACDAHKHHTVHTIHQILFVTSVSILAVFLAELLVLIAALGRLFIHNKLYVVDFIVVSASLVLEIYLHSEMAASVDTTGANLIYLIITARCWRFFRIGHGIMTTTHEIEHEEIAEMEEAQQHMQHMVDKLLERANTYQNASHKMLLRRP